MKKTQPALILYAEDNLMQIQLFLSVMEEIIPDFQVKFFRHGKALLEGFDNLVNDRHILPHLILLDVEMPVLNGISTLAQLRKEKRFQEIPILMFSSYKDEAITKQALALGANGFIEKPFDLDELESILRELDQKWCKLS